MSSWHQRNREYAKAWRLKNLEKDAEYKAREYVKRVHGITLEEAKRLRSKPCELCGGFGGALKDRENALDHDHTTGRFRGTLCHNCNKALGLLKDNVDLLTKAISYLKRKKEAA